MPLSNIRERFVEATGNYALMNPDGSDNGADQYIHDGNLFLDINSHFAKNVSSHFQPVAAGEYVVQTLERYRSIEGVFLRADSEGRKELIHTRGYRELIKLFPSIATDSTIFGAPTHYCVGIFRGTNVPLKNTNGAFIDASVGSENMYGIAFAPVADKDYTIEIVGLAYSTYLDADNSDNFWSITHPDLLVLAAMRSYALLRYRDKSSVEFYEKELLGQIHRLEVDSLHEITIGANRMKP